MVCGSSPYELVQHHNQFLAEIDLTHLSGMRRETKRKWIHNLDMVKKAWEIEREQRSKNQQVLTRFFGKKATLVESGMLN